MVIKVIKLKANASKAPYFCSVFNWLNLPVLFEAKRKHMKGNAITTMLLEAKGKKT